MALDLDPILLVQDGDEIFAVEIQLLGQLVYADSHLFAVVSMARSRCRLTFFQVFDDLTGPGFPDAIDGREMLETRLQKLSR